MFFFKMWLKRNQLKGDSPKGLLAQTARNACIDVFRKQKEDLLPYEDDVLRSTQSRNPYDLTELNEQMSILNHTVSAFEGRDRDIFLRFYYFGESTKEIAAKLQMNLSTVKTKLHRSREKIKRALEERGYHYD